MREWGTENDKQWFNNISKQVGIDCEVLLNDFVARHLMHSTEIARPVQYDFPKRHSLPELRTLTPAPDAQRQAPVAGFEPVMAAIDRPIHIITMRIFHIFDI